MIYVKNINTKIRWCVGGGGGCPGTCLSPIHPDTYGSAIDTVVNVHFLYISPLEYTQKRIQRRRTGRAPPFEFFKGFIFENFNSIIRINFIVINMQR